MDNNNSDDVTIYSGRVTQGVYGLSGVVHRPVRPNSAFVARALSWAHSDAYGAPLGFVPEYMGRDADGYDMFSFMPGDVPDNLGRFSDAQFVRAVELIRRFHAKFDVKSMPPEAVPQFLRDCPDGMTVCHGDLSPCNFAFTGGMPTGIIDFDACAFGRAIDDLAYAAWMWLDIGNAELSPDSTVERMRLMLDTYQADWEMRSLCAAMRRQMQRVADSIFPTWEQTDATKDWAEGCINWLDGRIMPLLHLDAAF